jgi:hypothetical protein
LAFEAQSCLGGAGLSYLSVDNLDYERLRMSTKIFTELSRIETSNADVRAGLGTSLLIQGIFYDEIISHEGDSCMDKDNSVSDSIIASNSGYLYDGSHIKSSSWVGSKYLPLYIFKWE